MLKSINENSMSYTILEDMCFALNEALRPYEGVKACITRCCEPCSQTENDNGMYMTIMICVKRGTKVTMHEVFTKDELSACLCENEDAEDVRDRLLAEAVQSLTKEYAVYFNQNGTVYLKTNEGYMRAFVNAPSGRLLMCVQICDKMGKLINDIIIERGHDGKYVLKCDAADMKVPSIDYKQLELLLHDAGPAQTENGADGGGNAQ